MLTRELPGLRIGLESVDWYQKEIDRYNELSNKFLEDISQYESDETEEIEQNRNAEYLKLLVGFSEPFLQFENPD